jgi:hypothetical protein
LKRHWIGIDITYQAISVILKRLEDTYGSDALNDVILSGIPKYIAAAAEALATRKDDRVAKNSRNGQFSPIPRIAPQSIRRREPSTPIPTGKPDAHRMICKTARHDEHDR